MRITREKAAENREKVVAAAARLFRERGLEGVGIDAVAAEAGLTHGAIYSHFASKDELAAAAIAQAMEQSMGEWLDLTKGLAAEPAFERLANPTCRASIAMRPRPDAPSPRSVPARRGRTTSCVTSFAAV